jgi:hypothetical protein
VLVPRFSLPEARGVVGFWPLLERPEPQDSGGRRRHHRSGLAQAAGAAGPGPVGCVLQINKEFLVILSLFFVLCDCVSRAFHAPRRPYRTVPRCRQTVGRHPRIVPFRPSGRHPPPEDSGTGQQRSHPTSTGEET